MEDEHENGPRTSSNVYILLSVPAELDSYRLCIDVGMLADCGAEILELRAAVADWMCRHLADILGTPARATRDEMILLDAMTSASHNCTSEEVNRWKDNGSCVDCAGVVN